MIGKQLAMNIKSLFVCMSSIILFYLNNGDVNELVS